MSETLDRAASAILGEMDLLGKLDYIAAEKYARAVLTSIRELTEAQLEAVYERYINGDAPKSFAEMYQTAIDAALTEDPK